MATYLVTGAAGFIGSNLSRALLKRGERVVGIDNFSTGRAENIRALDGLEFYEGSVIDSDLLDRALAEVDFVLHQAAIPSVPRSIEDPTASNEANVAGTLALLEAVRRRGTIKRFVYASSSSAYGDSEVLPKVESMPPNPLSPYAVSKLAGEYYCRVYHRVHRLPTAVLRYFNVFGPRQDPKSRYAAVIPIFIRAVLQNESPPIYGDGTQTRDFNFIDNVVEANLAACAAPQAVGGVFNVARGERVSLLSLLERINRLVDKSVTPKFLPARRGDIQHSLADISQAREQLGYRGNVSLDDGLQQTIDWYRNGTPG